jgi:hypothetical protein
MSGVAIEIDRALLDDLDQILGTDNVSAGLPGFFGLVAAGEHGNPQGAAGAVWQIADAAHDLIGMLGIDAKIDGDLDRFIELRDSPLFDHLHSLLDRIELHRIDAFGDLLQTLALCHGLSLHRQAHRPGGTSDDLGGLIEIGRVQVLQFLLRDVLDLSHGHRAGRTPAWRL